MPSRRDLANAIRALSMDAVQKANSGHPGAPMGMADIAEVLYNDFMKHSPTNPKWVDRDRFVMSNGHGSMMPYSLLLSRVCDLWCWPLRLPYWEWSPCYRMYSGLAWQLPSCLASPSAPYSPWSWCRCYTPPCIDCSRVRRS